jgi:serine/threonine protein kinase
MHKPQKDLLLGKRIREYEILEVLGQGGMGAVYRARHIYLEEQRAIKVIQTRLAQDPNFVNRFIREAKILTRLRHPNLVQLYEFGTLEEDVFFMVMEFLRGESLLKRIRRQKRIPVLPAARMVRQAALGLHSAHEQGIVHRDLSPDNLFLVHSDGREVTKVIDFGIAKPNFETPDHLTATGLFIGKPEYSSPEQCGLIEEGGSVDRRSDIYSLGVTFYHMLTGKLPFYSTTPQGYVLKHATESPRPISANFEPGCAPQGLDELLLKMLAKKRHERYPTMEHFIRDLDLLFPPDSEEAVTRVTMEIPASELEVSAQEGQTEYVEPQWTVEQESAVAPREGTQGKEWATPQPTPLSRTAVELTPKVHVPLWVVISAGLLIPVLVAVFGWWFFFSSRADRQEAGLQAGTSAKGVLKAPIPVTINALPWAEVTVRPIDVQASSARSGQQTGVTPCYFLLPEGEYRIELTNRFGPPIRQTIEVHPGSLNEFAFRMPSYDPQRALDEVEGW